MQKSALMETLNYRSMVKVIQRSRSVHMLSHSNTPLCQNLVFQCQRAKTIFPDSNSWWKYNFDIDVKGQGHRGYECTWHLILWWYTHMPNIVPLCQRTKSCGPNTKPMVNIISGLWIYATRSFMVIDPCAKYGKPMSNKKTVMGQIRKHVKNPVNWTLRSKGNIILGSWMYVTHCLVVIHPCAKYGQPTSNQNKVMGTNLPERRTDRRTDKRTDRVNPIYPPWTSFTVGIISICSNSIHNACIKVHKVGL